MRYENHDIGRVFGVVLLAVTGASIIETLFALISGSFQINYFLPFSLLIGLGVYQHRKIAYNILLWTLWVVMSVHFVISVALLTIRTMPWGDVSWYVEWMDVRIQNPTREQALACAIIGTTVLMAAIYFLRSEKARSEFEVD